MKILVIGGTGHVASFLVPQLLDAGHEVVVASRGKKALPSDSHLHGARLVTCDANSEESLKALAEAERFDVVIDFPGTAYKVYQVFKDKTDHIIACGSLWMLGYPKIVPTPEIPFGPSCSEGYARRFDEIRHMLSESGVYRAVFTAILPPNICGPGKIPLEGLGGRDIEIHKAHRAGQTVYLPEGPEALIGPCDASDIANLFALAVENRNAAAGQMFNVGSAFSLTSTQFIATYGKIYGVEIPVEYIPWTRYKYEISPGIGHWWHFYAHMQPDISKAQRLLGYKPRYTPEETMTRAVEWMYKEKLL